MKTYFLSLLFLFLTLSDAQSQWTQVYQTDSCNCSLGRWPIRGMAFFGSDSGVVFDNFLLSTTIDGGTTWKRNLLDRSISNQCCLKEMAFTDINHVWFNFSQFVYHSSDAGLHWEKDSIADELGYSITSLYFRDSLNGFAGGEGLLMFKTSDAGKTWQRCHQPETTEGNYEIHQIAFASPQIGIATAAEFQTLILRTTDGGEHWRNLSDLGHGIAGSTPRSLSFPDPAHAFFCTLAHLYNSSDSGKSWKQIVDAPINSFLSISFADSAKGISIVSRSTFTVGYTSDHGDSWRSFIIEADAKAISSSGYTSFTNPNTAYVRGLNAVFKLNINDLAVNEKRVDASLDDISVFPDPAHDFIRISCKNQNISAVSIIDFLGNERIHILDINSNNSDIDLSSLSTGLYCVKIFTAQTQTVRKILKW